MGPPIGVQVLLLSTFLQGCMVRHYAAPPAPERVAPSAVGVPMEPPAEGYGRVFVDVVDDEAKVSQVTETTNPSEARSELLCITPCAIDLRRGAHTLWLTSTKDSGRTSPAPIYLPSSDRPSAVRHALGMRTQNDIGAYVVGLWLTVAGSAFTLVGGAGTAVTLASPRGGNDTGSGGGALVFAALFGMAMLIPGVVLLLNNQSRRAPGSTTQWQL